MKNSNYKSRQGIATIEYVMVFPVLMILIAMLFTLQMSLKKQSEVITNVRNVAWQFRANPNSLNNNSPFGVLNMDKSGAYSKVLTSTNRMYRNWFPYVPRTSRWGNTVLNGSWNHRQVRFDTGSFIYPHLGVLKQMAEGQVVDGGDASQVGSLTGFPGL
jgi:hypothetical protein